MNEPYRVNLTDDGEWYKMNVNSKNGTVCSYKLQYPNRQTNIYQVRIANYSNILMGLYFYS